MKLDKDVYRYINFELRHFTEYEQEIKEIEKDIIESSPIRDCEGRSEGTTGDPTASKVIKLDSNIVLERKKRTVDKIKKVYELLNEEYKKFFDLKYIKKVGIVKICNDMPMSEKTHDRWKNKIIYMIAEEMGYF